MFYTFFVVLNLIAVGLDLLNDFFEKGEIVVKKGHLALYIVIILSGFTGTIILAGLLLIEKVPTIAKKFDEEITIIKDDIFSSFG